LAQSAIKTVSGTNAALVTAEAMIYLDEDKYIECLIYHSKGTALNVGFGGANSTNQHRFTGWLHRIA